MKKIELLESRLAMVKSKLKTKKNKRVDKKLSVLEDSKNEIQNRLDMESEKLSFIEQQIRDIEKNGDLNPLDFNNIDQLDDENNLNEFLDLAENNKTIYDRISVFDVIVDSQRDIHPFILNGDFMINNGEPFLVNRFCKDFNYITKSIEKMIDKYDETFECCFRVIR